LDTEEKENSSFTLVELTTPKEPARMLKKPSQPRKNPLLRLKTSQVGANFWITRRRAIFHQEMERETTITQKCTGNRPSFTAKPSPNRQSQAKVFPRPKIRSSPEISRRNDPHA